MRDNMEFLLAVGSDELVEERGTSAVGGLMTPVPSRIER